MKLVMKLIMILVMKLISRFVARFANRFWKRLKDQQDTPDDMQPRHHSRSSNKKNSQKLVMRPGLDNISTGFKSGLLAGTAHNTIFFER